MAIEIRTMTAGNMWKILVKPGDPVAAGDTLFIMEVMKTEIPHTAPEGGTVSIVSIAEGDSVDADELAVVLE
jgi:acetyl-CoA carboxylase biotin carboxyl carrier protein